MIAALVTEVPSATAVVEAAKIWLPRGGKVLAKFPGGGWEVHALWLAQTIAAPSRAIDERGYWVLPRNCANRLVRASIDRFGLVDVYRDMAVLARCNRLCLEALGVECECGCLGEHHGEASTGLWFERRGDAVVADMGSYVRVKVTYWAKRADIADGLRLYGAELAGVRYTTDPDRRAAWPPINQFACLVCITSRAEVWDHCHRHGAVRGPLCNRCNTRNWHGWSPEHGRTLAEMNVDASYYRNCPGFPHVGDPLKGVLSCTP